MRRKLKTPYLAQRLRPWTKKEHKLLGTAKDEEIARRLGRTRLAVTSRRIIFGISGIPVHKPWTKAELRLLGTAPDKIIADRLGRGIRAIQHKRTALKIPYALSRTRPWTSREEKLLGTEADKEIARQLERTEKSVRVRRLKLKRPSGNILYRPWTKKEMRMIGQKPDIEVAHAHLTVLGIVVKDDGGLLFGLAILTAACSVVTLWLHWRQVPFLHHTCNFGHHHAASNARQ